MPLEGLSVRMTTYSERDMVTDRVLDGVLGTGDTGLGLRRTSAGQGLEAKGQDRGQGEDCLPPPGTYAWSTLRILWATQFGAEMKALGKEDRPCPQVRCSVGEQGVEGAACVVGEGTRDLLGKSQG